MTIRRRFLNVGERQAHYLRAGDGPVVVLLHPAPLSARILEPLVAELAKDYTAIAFDRPGFGFADLLDLEQPEIADYADAVIEDLDALGVERCVLYGTATGSIVSLELARRHPERVQSLILESLPIVTDEEREYLLTQYAPRWQPDWTGMHVPYIWTVGYQLHVFWPWSRWDRAGRRDADMPPIDEVQQGVVDLFRIGPEGHLAYNAVWRYHPLEALHELEPETSILAREDNVLYEHLKRLPDRPNITVVPTERDEEFVQLWHSHPRIIKEIVDRARPDGPPPPDREAGPLPGRIARDYVDVSSTRQVRFRRLEDAGGRPLVMLHRGADSGASLEPAQRELGATRPVLVLDIPGLGGSDAPEGEALEAYADVVLAALDGAGLGEIDLLGEEVGAVLAVAVAARAGARVRRLVLVGAPVPEPGVRDELLERYTVPLEPRFDGGHLSAAWSYVRDMELYSPWYRRTRRAIVWRDPADVEQLHQRFVDLLGAAGTYAGVYRAALEYDLAAGLRDVDASVLIVDRCAGMPADAEALARLAPGAEVVSGDDLAAVCEAFLADAGAVVDNVSGTS
jgi:pimeloyl-ACP methyl ester carboxylesterase